MTNDKADRLTTRPRIGADGFERDAIVIDGQQTFDLVLPDGTFLGRVCVTDFGDDAHGLKDRVNLDVWACSDRSGEMQAPHGARLMAFDRQGRHEAFTGSDVTLAIEWRYSAPPADGGE